MDSFTIFPVNPHQEQVNRKEEQVTYKNEQVNKY